jgi:hypothetical protein
MVFCPTIGKFDYQRKGNQYISSHGIILDVDKKYIKASIESNKLKSFLVTGLTKQDM